MRWLVLVKPVVANADPLMSSPAPGIARPLHICSFESRRSREIAALIERQGAVATVAPSMREIPLAENVEALEFARELLAGRIDVVVFMTGVGAAALLEAIETRHRREEFFAALSGTQTVVRGPKPAAVLREWKVRIDHRVPEPNTWREVLAVLEGASPLAGRTVAIQEYGKPTEELYRALEQRGAHVRAVPVYRWALPEDLGPLREAIRSTIDGAFEVLMFTSAQQVDHVLTVAEQEGVREQWVEAARRTVIASIGPTCSERLVEAGLPSDLEPSHPKMGHLGVETVAQAPDLLPKP